MRRSEASKKSDHGGTATAPGDGDLRSNPKFCNSKYRMDLGMGKRLEKQQPKAWQGRANCRICLLATVKLSTVNL